MEKNNWYIISVGVVAMLLILWIIALHKPKDEPPVLVDPIKKETKNWDTNVPAALYK